MYKISMHIHDPGIKLVARAMLEAEGHVLSGESCCDVVLCDDVSEAHQLAKNGNVLLLCRPEDVPKAVQAMLSGVYGYVLLPFIPGELTVMIQRTMAKPKNTLAAKVSGTSLAEAEKTHILDTLRSCKYNQAEAARRLDIGRNTLWRKLKNIHIDPIDKA